MSRQRFYIGKKEPDELAGDLEEWVADKIPNAPEGTKCECSAKDCHAEEAGAECLRFANSYLWRIMEGHVCYTFVCMDCEEHNGADDYLADQDYPTTGDGYAVVPAHCVE